MSYTTKHAKSGSDLAFYSLHVLARPYCAHKYCALTQRIHEPFRSSGTFQMILFLCFTSAKVLRFADSGVGRRGRGGRCCTTDNSKQFLDLLHDVELPLSIA